MQISRRLLALGATWLGTSNAIREIVKELPVYERERAIGLSASAYVASKALVRLVLKDDKVVGEERLLTARGERIRDVVEGPDGAIWMVTDAELGKLLRITPR